MGKAGTSASPLKSTFPVTRSFLPSRKHENRISTMRQWSVMLGGDASALTVRLRIAFLVRVAGRGCTVPRLHHRRFRLSQEESPCGENCRQHEARAKPARGLNDISVRHNLPVRCGCTSTGGIVHLSNGTMPRERRGGRERPWNGPLSYEHVRPRTFPSFLFVDQDEIQGVSP